MTGGRPVTVRVRILTAVLITTALGMMSAATVSYLLARQSVHDGIWNDLAQESEEIKIVAALAAAGESGRAITGPSDVLYLAIKSAVPDPGEAIYGVVNGKIAWVPTSDDPFQQTISADTELLNAAISLPVSDQLVVHEISTRQHPSLAYISIPISVTGSSDTGFYVAVVDEDAAFAPINRTHLTYALVCVIALAVVALVGYRVAGRLLAPLRALEETTQRITETDLTMRIPAEQLAGQDEVARLGRTVNAMLDRLNASFDNQRQILDDAGHELRTPITIVRGHLELLDVHDATDVERTRDLAVEELDRMQRLVEDILLLAKAQRPDFVHPEQVEVGDLLVATLDKITPLADRRWHLDQLSTETAELDPQRITQALVQLVANAVKATDPGAVIALGAAVEGGQLRIWVRDEGRGIEEADRVRIFERFDRGSTARDHDGAGLGLAIVSAIATAHHGDVELESVPGSGSRFTLRFPASVLVRERVPTQEEESAWQPS